MKKFLAVLAIAAGGFGLAACGGASSAGSATQNQPSSTTPAQTFFDMPTLAADLKTQETNRLNDKTSTYYSPTTTVTNETCIQSGAQTAECLAKFSDGQTAGATVTIAQDGQSYITK